MLQGEFFSLCHRRLLRRIVGWQFASHVRTTLVLDALLMALARRDPGADVALVHHSDRGSRVKVTGIHARRRGRLVLFELVRHDTGPVVWER